MSEENVELDRQNRDLEVLRDVYSHWERGDFTYSEVFAEDYVWKAVDAIESGEYAGFGEVSPAWRTWLQAWDGFSIEAEEMIAGSDGRYVVMQLFRGKGKASGLESEERSACVVTMRDGLIARMEGFWDRDAAFQAAEALRAAGDSTVGAMTSFRAHLSPIPAASLPWSHEVGSPVRYWHTVVALAAVSAEGRVSPSPPAGRADAPKADLISVAVSGE